MSLSISPGAGASGQPRSFDIRSYRMPADLTLFVDRTRQILVQGSSSLQPLVSLSLTQAENIGVAVQILDFTGNGLQPFVNVDPTGWQLQFALGYFDSTGAKKLIASATTTALTAISGFTSQTALAFTLNTGLNAAATAVSGVLSVPVWAELAWNPTPTANTGYMNKVQIQGALESGFLGVGLSAPS